jgi:hypothetical protein
VKTCGKRFIRKCHIEAENTALVLSLARRARAEGRKALLLSFKPG